MPAKKTPSSTSKKSSGKKKKVTAKKTTKKPPKKARNTSASRKKKQTNKRGIERDIKQAVDRLPDFVISESAKQKKHDMLSDLYKRPIDKKETIAIPAPKDTKKHLLVAGVTTIAVMIFAVWAWNLRTMFYDAGTVRAETMPMWSEAAADFTAALNTLAPREEEGTKDPTTSERDVKENIEATLANIFAETPTSTEPATPTTTERDAPQD